ncbi:GAF domain-containing protein [Patescibacteria group bacterium]|nr:GAF domain-containing protein [Patescibacteria group bacterium]
MSKHFFKQVDKILAGDLEFKSLAQKAVDFFTEEMGFVGAAIMRKENEEYSRAYIYTVTDYTKKLATIFPVKFNKIRIPIQHPESLIGKSQTQNEENFSSDLQEATKGFLLPTIAKALQKSCRVKKIFAAPIRINEKAQGVFIVGTNKKDFSDEQIAITRQFVDRLGLAMKNVIAHEKILEKFKENTSSKELSTFKKNLEIIKQTNRLFSEKLDFKDLSNEAVNLFSEKMGFAATAVFVKDGDMLRTCAFSHNKLVDFIHDILPMPMYKVTMPCNKPINYLGKTAQTGNEFIGRNIKDFADKAVPDSLLKTIQKGSKVQTLFSLPIKNNNHIIGVLLCTTKEKSFSNEQIEIARTFSDQLAIAMGNALAHEKIVHKYKERLENTNNVTSGLSLKEYFQTISNTNTLLTGELDFKKISEKAVKAFTDELGFVAGAIFRRENPKSLRAYIYTDNTYTKRVTQLLSMDFSSIKTPIDEPINLIGETGKTGEIHFNKSLLEFTRGFVDSDKMVHLLQRVSSAKYMGTFPIIASGTVEGVLFVGTKASSFTPDQISLIKIFAEQLGLSMGNIIAHEKIIEKFRREQEQRKRNIDPDKKPTIKFTLRISKEIERYLSWKINNTDKTKADFLREVITEDLIADDEEYQKFIKD